MTLIIVRLDGKRYNLEELGIRVVEFEPESPNIQNDVVNLDGGGVVVQERGYGSRYISASFRIHNPTLVDYALFRAELFALFGTTEQFYIIDMKEPGKRWRVRTDGNFALQRAIRTGNFNINFICTKIFAESIRTSLDLQYRKQWDVDLWAWGMGIDWDSTYMYAHNSNSFVISNIGNARIDPTSWSLEITVKAIADSYLEIRNITTGDIYRYNGALIASDTLVIRGVRTFKNNVGAFANTNYKLISLVPGDNEFIVTGGNVQSITFNFRFPYK